MSLEPEGKITSHLVKYSHHPDGRAHFSQDGRVFTRVRKQAVPLDAVEGHVFTVKLQGLAAFERVAPGEDREASLKRTSLNFDFGTETPQAVAIVGFLYREESVYGAILEGEVGPMMTLTDPHGKHRQAFMCSAPLGRLGENRILALTCEAIPPLTSEEETTLTFIGGFDSGEVANAQRAMKMLALIYPAQDAEVLASRLGTIDLVTTGLTTTVQT